MAYKIGLVVIATNKYIKFVKPLLESVKKHFLVGQDVQMMLFTNHNSRSAGFEDYPESEITFFHQDHIPWPGSTLFRYNIFHQAKKHLAEKDYIFYCDADMLFVGDVGAEVLSDRVGTIHPGFYDKPREAFTYETKTSSRAAVAPSEGTVYYAGGFNGGTSIEYIRMCEVLSEKIADDYKRGVIAVWHDESHLNRYFIDNPPTVSLSPSYCYPESWLIPFEKRLLALDKDHKEVRT